MAGPRRNTRNVASLRWLFWAWVGMSVLVGIYVCTAGPFASYIGEGRSVVALAVPALMLFMLTTGLGWLVYFVNVRRRRTAE